ncbi:MAG: hypothetical protein RL538_884 [Candidatus Parcubacteria bacterium]|jgi:hypothetical protein
MLYKILTYALVILTGMTMAAFLAYYLLNTFVYPVAKSNIQHLAPEAPY